MSIEKRHFQGPSKHHWPADPEILLLSVLQRLRDRIKAAETREDIAEAIRWAKRDTKEALTILRLDPTIADWQRAKLANQTTNIVDGLEELWG